MKKLKVFSLILIFSSVVFCLNRSQSQQNNFGPSFAAFKILCPNGTLGLNQLVTLQVGGLAGAVALTQQAKVPDSNNELSNPCTSYEKGGKKKEWVPSNRDEGEKGTTAGAKTVVQPVVTEALYDALRDTLVLRGTNLCPDDMIKCGKIIGGVDKAVDKATMLTEIKKITLAGATAVSLNSTSLFGAIPTAADLEVGIAASGEGKIAFRNVGTQISIRFNKAKASAELENRTAGKPYDFNLIHANSVRSTTGTAFGGITTAGMDITVSGFVGLARMTISNGSGTAGTIDVGDTIVMEWNRDIRADFENNWYVEITDDGANSKMRLYAEVAQDNTGTNLPIYFLNLAGVDYVDGANVVTARDTNAVWSAAGNNTRLSMTIGAVTGTQKGGAGGITGLTGTATDPAGTTAAGLEFEDKYAAPVGTFFGVSSGGF